MDTKYQITAENLRLETATVLRVTLNPKVFVDALNGKKWHHTRTQLTSLWVSDDREVVPERPTYQENGAAISIAHTIYCYENKDLFTEEYGVLVAVVQSGAGHLWCDRFVPEG